jgi:site-specific DNA recombinase
MSTPKKKIVEYERALIYCRVSSQRQVTDGHGLDSQELRCVHRAEYLKLKVAKVFPDEGISGGLFGRPAMQELIAFLDAHPNEKFVIIFDDLKRFARDVEVHLKLKTELVTKRAVKLECLNFNFEDSPIGRAVETIMAATAQLEREQNAEQVKNKMKSRLEAGYWPFDYPPGLTNLKDPVHGKLLAPHEPKASIVRQVLEGFAKDRFSNQTEVQEFLEQNNFFHRHRGKKVHLEQVKRMLTNVLYAGYIEYPKWGVAFRKGHHDGLISIDTFQQIQDKLNGKVKLYARMKDRQDLPVRGFVLCNECGKPYTASFTKKHRENKDVYKVGYYRCRNSECPKFNKGVRQDILENQFIKMLKDVEPTPQALELTKAIVLDVWHKKVGEFASSGAKLKNEITEIDKSIDLYLDRLNKTTSDEVIKVYEEKITGLKKQKTILEDSLGKRQHAPVSFETALDVVCEFVKSPIKLWGSDDFADKKLVHRLVFEASVSYTHGFGFETAKISLPFEVFRLIGASNSRLVEMPGVKPGSKTCSASNCSQD